MTEFLGSGRVFELVLVILVLEGIAVLALSRRPFWRARVVLSAGDLAGFVIAGLGLATAAIAVVRDLGWWIVAAGLTIAFLAHLYDLRRRVLAARGRGASTG